LIIEGSDLNLELLLSLHPDDEVAAISAHELGHLTESRMMLSGRLLGVLIYLPFLYIKPLTSPWRQGGVLTAVLMVWLVYSLTRRLSRRLEARADRLACAHEPDAGTYARALAKLHEENLIPAVMPRQRSHPDLYDRLLAAGVQPDYPRPKKPSALAFHALVLSILLGVLIVGAINEGPDQPSAPPPFGLRRMRQLAFSFASS
jgi:hypothetical protein